MCNMSLQPGGFNNNAEPLSFSTFHLLRTCNRLMLPSSDTQSYYNLIKDSRATPTSNVDNITTTTTTIDYGNSTCMSTSTSSKSSILDVIETMPLPDSIEAHDTETRPTEYADSGRTKTPPVHAAAATTENAAPPLSAFRSSTALPPLPALGMLPLTGSGLLVANKPPPPPPPSLPAFEYIAPANHALSLSDFPLMELNRVGVFPAFLHRRSRGEKRPIPEEQKDDKYYERRKRNNEAAKKSRDARKIREDRIAFRAALLEQENSILRAQLMSLRDELQTMRQLISTATTATTLANVGRNAAQL